MSGVLSSKLARRLLDDAPEGVLVCDAQLAGFPLIFVNRRFELWTGGGAGGLLGQGLLQLPCVDQEQAALENLRAAMQQAQSVRTVLRLIDREGATLWVDVLIEPIHDEAVAVTHFVAYCRKLAADANAGPPVLQPIRPKPSNVISIGAATATPVSVNLSAFVTRDELLSGDEGRQRFEDLLRLQWSAGQREGRALTLLLFQVDALPAYIETFGRPAAESCMRKLARVMTASYRRGTDVVARLADGTFCALVQSADLAATTVHAQGVAERIFEMQIHNPRSNRHRFITVSVGVAHTIPALDQAPQLLMQAATQAARRAQSESINRAVVADENDFISLVAELA